MRKLKVLDLFSGIGGFSLGLERTGGFETVAFCEIEDFPRRVLKKNYAGIFVHADVRELREYGSVDVVTGGFPCQDLSEAGQGRGIVDGERSGLWREMYRIIGDIRPKFAVIENVSGLLIGGGGMWFRHLLADLASIGYDAEWHRISAGDIGASHIRERVWIVANPSEAGRRQSIFKGRSTRSRDLGKQLLSYSDIEGFLSWVTGQRQEYRNLSGKPLIGRNDNGFRVGMDRVAALGNAVVPQIPEIIGHAILEAERNPHA